MVGKLKPCPCCGDPLPGMVRDRHSAYVACSTFGCWLEEGPPESGMPWRELLRRRRGLGRRWIGWLLYWPTRGVASL